MNECNDETHIGFGNDPFVRDEVLRLIDTHGIRTVIETGTFLGYTARALARTGAAVHTIESDHERYLAAVANLRGYPTVSVYEGPSEWTMPGVTVVYPGPFLFYLDAHWPDSPVLDELAVIAELAPDSVIVIHDVKNPFHPEYGFDTYGETVLDIDYLRDALAKCFTVPWREHYNDEAAGNRVGVLYVEPVRG